MTSERGAVELVNVTKRFGTMVAVDRVNLDVHAGEFLSLLGPSGCGKTTTLRMLAGFEQPDEGHIRISGEFVQGVPPYKRDVNTVFQHYALFPHMTVAENVGYGLRQKSTPKSQIVEAGRRGARDGEDVGAGEPQAAPDVGRSATTRRPRPRRSSTVRACCCSTNRSAPSIASYARRCRSS